MNEGTGKYSLKVIYPKIVFDNILFISASKGAADKGVWTIFMATRNKSTVLVLTLVLITTFSFVPRQIVYAETTPSARIIGYAGSPGTNYEYVEWNKLTEVVIGTIAVTSSTNPTIMDASGTHFTTLTNIRNEAQAVKPNIKVLAQLTGGNWQSWDDGHLTAIMGNASYRSQLATNLASFVSTYSLDGIDIDWEGTDIAEANYHAFLVSLRADLPSGKIIS
ncbi:MAG: glycoside hydrolase family 18 protein, partial [Dehalococcoidales bacterium]